MKTFLAVYTGAPSAFTKWQDMDEQQRKQLERKGIQAWHDWIDQHKTSIKDVGEPLGKTKCINADGISDITNNLTGYTIIEAETYESAARLFVDHPHFSIFPGDSVEIMECLPIPKPL